MNANSESKRDDSIPQFLYGTAWKEDQTKALVRTAIQQGFRAIDTANQRKHYYEAAVGEAIRELIQDGVIRSDDLFLQTKYTFQRGQDHRLPYDPHAPIRVQVEQSFASSLQHLGCSSIDSYVLHGPTRRVGLVQDDWDAWHAMESLFDQGRVRMLGVSNVSLEQLTALCQAARIRPRFVQNRCYASMGWDRDVRAFCREHQIVYQGFSLLTANRDVLAKPQMIEMARHHQRTAAQIIFRFAVQIGMLPLTGTTNPRHMQQDLNIFDFELTPDEVKLIEIAGVSISV